MGSGTRRRHHGAHDQEILEAFWIFDFRFLIRRTINDVESKISNQKSKMLERRVNHGRA